MLAEAGIPSAPPRPGEYGDTDRLWGSVSGVDARLILIADGTAAPAGLPEITRYLRQALTHFDGILSLAATAAAPGDALLLARCGHEVGSAARHVGDALPAPLPGQELLESAFPPLPRYIGEMAAAPAFTRYPAGVPSPNPRRRQPGTGPGRKGRPPNGR